MSDLDKSGITFNIRVTVKPQDGATFIWATRGGGPDSEFCVAMKEDHRSNNVVDPQDVATEVMDMIWGRRHPADALWRVTAVQEASGDLHI